MPKDKKRKRLNQSKDESTSMKPTTIKCRHKKQKTDSERSAPTVNTPTVKDDNTLQKELLTSSKTGSLDVLIFSAHFNTAYAELVTDTAVSKKYIRGRNYQKVEECLVNKTKVIFTGPKGVGKTACLLAYWQQYINARQKVILLGVNTIKKFSTDFCIQSYLESLHEDFFNSENVKDEVCLQYAVSKYIILEKPIVLLDLTLMSSHEDVALSLLQSCKQASFCLISISSGSGADFTNTRMEEKLDNALFEFKPVEFLPFDKQEAVLFVRVFNEGDSREQSVSCERIIQSEAEALSEKGVWTKEDGLRFVKQLKPYAGYNPYLLKYARRAENMEDARAVCYKKTEQFIERTLPRKGPLFLKNVESIAKIFHFVKENALVDSLLFKKSYVHRHRLAYVVTYSTSTQVQIAINFPLLPGILKCYLHENIGTQDRMNDVLQYPAVQGYLMESEFFARPSLNVAILVDSQNSAGCPSVASLTFHGYFVNHVEEVVDKLVTNNLYHLRINHPIIDAVGILSNEVGDKWLVFIQISKRPYERHSANLRCLFTNKKGVDGYEELSKDQVSSTLFDYYCGLAHDLDIDISCILYLYVSTSTYYDGNVEVFKKMEEHAESKCNVGLLTKQSDMYCTFIKYQYAM